MSFFPTTISRGGAGFRASSGNLIVRGFPIIPTKTGGLNA